MSKPTHPPLPPNWTEREAWLYLAKCWRTPELHDNYPYVVAIVNGVKCQGICLSIERLTPIRTRWPMDDRLAREFRKACPSGYLYPRTLAGAKRRVALCLKFARQCGRKA